MTTAAGRELVSYLRSQGLNADPHVADQAKSAYSSAARTVEVALEKIEAEAQAALRLDADFLRAVHALTEEVYVPHHTPSSESGPEEWDVELLAPESETVERVIRHLAAYEAAASEDAS